MDVMSCKPVAGATCDAEGKCGTFGDACPPPCSGEICETIDDGPWLLGWSGGLDHFSWVRFSFTPMSSTEGQIDLLDPVCASCTPYFSCQGPGSFKINTVTNEVDMKLPMGCDELGAPQIVTLAFAGLAPAMGYPPKAILTASVSVVSQPMAQQLEGYQYPPEHCDPGFGSCADPFQ
jgi:hypothetical protein